MVWRKRLILVCLTCILIKRYEEQIQDILSLGKNTAYRLANSGQFKTVRVGSAIRISKKSFDEWLDQNLGE